MSIWMLFCLLFMKPHPYWQPWGPGSIGGKIVFVCGGVVIFDQHEWGEYRILFASEDMRAGKVGPRPATLPGKWTELSTGSYATLEKYRMGRFDICIGVQMCKKDSMPREKPPPKEFWKRKK